MQEGLADRQLQQPRRFGQAVVGLAVAPLPGYPDSSDAPVDTSNGSSVANMMAGTQGIAIVKAAKEKMASRMKQLTCYKELEETCEALRGKSSLDISDAECFF